MADSDTGQTGADTGNASSGASDVGSTPISLSDDSLVTFKGVDKPVKFGEHYRGLQSQLTKTAQERSRLQQELERVKSEQARYQQASQQRQQGMGTQQARQASIAEQLRSLPYLNGNEAARVVESIESQIGDMRSGSQQQIQALAVLAYQLKQMQDQQRELVQQRRMTDFQGKLGKWREELNLPEAEGIQDWLHETYVAYEGDDLDERFPDIAKKRWEQLAAAVRASDKRRAEELRKQRFVPGKGGEARPSKGLDERLDRASPKEAADILFENFVAGAGDSTT